jgi:quercetin dioxygenase-like cupin family protein
LFEGVVQALATRIERERLGLPMLGSHSRGGTVASTPVLTLGPDDGECIWFFGTLTTFRVSADRSASGMCVVHQVIPAGFATPLHVQPDDEETFHVLEGRFTFWANGETYSAEPGATVHLPAGTPHAYRVDSDGGQVLDITTARHEAFFRACGDPALRRELPPPAEPDLGRVVAAGEKYGVDILGPPPG